VQISLKVNGVSFTASATFNVKRPVAQITAQTGTISIATRADGNQWLQYGTGTPTDKGISFSRTITLPSGFLGDTQWAQIYTPNRRRQLTVNGVWESLTGAGLDTRYPYSSATATDDSPDTILTLDFVEKTVSDTGQMYLMFQPFGTGSGEIWVPLRKVNLELVSGRCPKWEYLELCFQQ